VYIPRRYISSGDLQWSDITDAVVKQLQGSDFRAGSQLIEELTKRKRKTGNKKLGLNLFWLLNEERNSSAAEEKGSLKGKGRISPFSSCLLLTLASVDAGIWADERNNNLAINCKVARGKVWFVGPFQETSNRVTRQFGAHRFLRVSFELHKGAENLHKEVLQVFFAFSLLCFFFF